jgi:hypothetical protein
LNDVDRLLARAQVGLAFLFAIGFIAILGALMFLSKDLSATATTVLTGLLSVFGTILTLQMNFFYARQRQPALPDPTTTTTTASTTTTTLPSPPAPGSAPVQVAPILQSTTSFKPTDAPQPENKP